MTIWENFLFYFNDLSNFYFLTIIISIIVVIISIYLLKTCEMYENKNNRELKDKTEEEEIFNKYFKDETFFGDKTNSENDDDSDDIEDMDLSGGLVGKLKTERLKAIEETLSPEQKVAEKEIEKEQLATIFDMLKKQEEEFNLGKMGEDDFKAQLSLYR